MTTQERRLGGSAVPRYRLGDEVTRRIRDAILGGAYPPGERLVVQALADELGVSAMPVREALIALSNEGLVETLPGRGFRALEVRPSDIEDVFSIHSFIAGALAERAAKAISSDVIGELRALQAEITESLASHGPDMADVIEERNHHLHRRINSIVDAPRLKWFLRTTTRHMGGDYHRTVPMWPLASSMDHGPIIDALAAHDGPQARRLMEEHVARGGRLAAEHAAGSRSGDDGTLLSAKASSESTVQPNLSEPMAP